MTNEEKQLLLKDICARIPYGLFCQTEDGKGKLISVECSTGEDLVYVDLGYPEAKECDLNEGDSIKPYLRPMPSVTEEEYKDLVSLVSQDLDLNEVNASIEIDWLLKHHFDFRGLIPMGLAIEAPEGIYKTE